MPETVAVGDYVDVVCSMQAYNDQVQGRTASTADVSRYYSVTVDVDGVDGSVEPAVSVHASGASVTMTAKHEDPNYSFSHWEKLVGETWEQVSTEPSHTITVGEVDEQYRAVFNYAAWALLPGTYVEALVETPDKVNGDAGGDAFAVLTEGVLHTEGAWTSGAFNSSWRTIIAVDKDGKVAYAVSNPANGYGGPSGSGYYAHPDYADYTLNPAFNILEGYGPWTAEAPDASKKFEIVVPEGGFILTAHGTDGELLWTTLGAEAGAGDAGHNTREALDHSARVFYDEANNALRVLALGIKKFTEMPTQEQLEQDLTFVGLVGMIDPARPEVKESIQIATKAGIKTVMITGDHIVTACAIAKELGILKEGDRAITSQELEELSENLQNIKATVENYGCFFSFLWYNGIFTNAKKILRIFCDFAAHVAEID